MTHLSLKLITALACLLLAHASFAQLTAHYVSRTDNACKTIYLVNQSVDSIFYIAGMEQTDLKECQTFESIDFSIMKRPYDSTRNVINLSRDLRSHLLLLPKDTIAYRMLISVGDDDKRKDLHLLARYSPSVIATNATRKRNKQIRKLPAKWLTIPVSENR
jgi:hypothetical protein